MLNLQKDEFDNLYNDYTKAYFEGSMYSIFTYHVGIAHISKSYLIRFSAVLEKPCTMLPCEHFYNIRWIDSYNVAKRFFNKVVSSMQNIGHEDAEGIGMKSLRELISKNLFDGYIKDINWKFCINKETK